MSFPAYSQYRDSGVEWIGQIPEDWGTFRVVHKAQVVNGFPFDSGLFTDATGLPLMRIRDLNSMKTECYFSGQVVCAALITSADLLIGMDGDFNVGRWLGDGPALLNQRVCCLRADHNISRWLEYALPNPLKRINDVTYSTTVKHLSSRDVENIRLALPPTQAEVDCILTILDQETAKIDNLIAEQERLVALLEEKRQAVIFHAVTKGLDASATNIPCGRGWLKEIPAHWKIRKLTALARLETGHTPSRQHPEYWIPEDCLTPWFTLADVNILRDGRTFNVSLTSEKISQVGIDNSAARLLPSETVILSRTASVGFSGIIDVPMAVSQDFAAWICGPQLRPKYLLFCLRSMYQEFRRLMFGSTHKTIYMPDIEALRIPLPLLEEQDEIIFHIERAVRIVDDMLDESGRVTALLKERRAALISAAVTGKIDVRGLVDTGLPIQAAAE